MPLKDHIARAAYNAAYRARTNEQFKAYKRAWQKRRYAEDPQYREAQLARLKEIPPHVSAARQRVYYAVKSGRLVRPTACDECGCACKPEAAHYAYNEPLRVRWLCRPCHRRWDGQSPKGGYSPPPTD